MLKKIILGAFCSLIAFTCLGGISSTYAQSNQNSFGADNGVSGIGIPGTDEKQQDGLLQTIKTAINRVLGILALVALVLCLYAGFKMMISGGDSKGYDAGIKIMKNAAIGLAFIALSRLIVSLIFWLINIVTEPNIVD